MNVMDGGNIKRSRQHSPSTRTSTSPWYTEESAPCTCPSATCLNIKQRVTCVLPFYFSQTFSLNLIIWELWYGSFHQIPQSKSSVRKQFETSSLLTAVFDFDWHVKTEIVQSDKWQRLIHVVATPNGDRKCSRHVTSTSHCRQCAPNG